MASFFLNPALVVVVRFVNIGCIVSFDNLFVFCYSNACLTANDDIFIACLYIIRFVCFNIFVNSILLIHRLNGINHNKIIIH